MMFLIPIISAIAPILIPSLVKAVIPKVVEKAENEFPEVGAGVVKKEWVMNFFADLVAILEAHGVLKGKALEVANSILPMISPWIEKAVEKMKAKRA